MTHTTERPRPLTGVDSRLPSEGRAGPIDATTFRAASDLLAFVDELPRSSTGELSLRSAHGRTDGTVFVERGRVCWAAARGLERRLSQLLAERAKLGTRDMNTLYLRCRDARVPLGEHLVASGVLRAAELRDALVLHTTESLRTLIAEPTTATWVPRYGTGYSPRFTFPTSELLVRTTVRDDEELAELVEAELASIFEAEIWGAAFARAARDRPPTPMAVHGAIPERASSLLEAGRWAVAALASGVGAQADALLATESTDDGLVAFVHRGFVLAGRIGTRGAARVEHRRAESQRWRRG